MLTPVALIYDFDGTLSPGNMQEFGFISAIGTDNKEFWKRCNQMSIENDASGILCYMYQMINEAKKNDIKLTRESFQKFGSKIKLYEGVKDWFKTINNYGKANGIDIKHYINSSGLKEMIEGSQIASEFANIYACSFLYNEEGNAYWPAVAVDYTTKTQFLFKINKGIKEISDNKRINEYIPEDERAMPFQNMIYFGDGETDIPSMKMIKERGGHSIAVYKPGDKEKKAIAEKLIREQRVNFACPANYSVEKSLYKIVKRILDKIKADSDFDRLIKINRKRIETRKS
ncbi:MAG: haloacid dehalogenase-like hydrolase [Bacteroidales bacterium]|nr:haloacid dehalogenase-like hydrolase [Bacteroidales bacterium]